MQRVMKGVMSLSVAGSLGCPPSDGVDGGGTTPPDAAVVLHVDGGTGAGAGVEVLSERELGWLAADLPAATHKRVVDIPEALLTEEEVLAENTNFWELRDGAGNVVGYARDIFTHVDCVAHNCQAIRYLLVFDAAVAFLDVFHQPELANDFMKYWEGRHQPMDAGDRARLRTLCASPPPELLAVTDVSVLVVDSTATAATVLEYQPHVVRGAAFTTYMVVNAAVDTRVVIDTVLGRGDGGTP
jgi:hypothetical protein